MMTKILGNSRHGAKIGAAVHGAPDQGLSHVAVVKCQNSQVSGMGSRDKRDHFGPNGTT
jgi:hypothetical protein